MTIQTLKRLSAEEARAAVAAGAAFLDLRSVDEYLDVHIRGSLCNLYEAGPGFAGRARDCIPLDVPLLLIGEDAPLDVAAAALRGKGFTVVGACPDALNRSIESGEEVVSTEVLENPAVVDGLPLDVGDPGAQRFDEATRITADRLWERLDEVAGKERVVVIAGAGVRAALCVGILERAGVADVVYWKT